ncbi:hypothetical protein A0H81_10313 [Grifola frondosa]|uniref:Uncharacterized protein n=1 Tax=Grifola frondosa TaxID=5627 RepID=A0A1C7LYR8_GRIFR|nr:hypothetical protein A0H81_10313 [Grifola frondosa]
MTMMEVDTYLSQLLGSMTIDGQWQCTDVKGKRRARANTAKSTGDPRRKHVRFVRLRGLDLPAKPLGILKLHRRRTATLRLRTSPEHLWTDLRGTLRHHGRGVSGSHLHSPRGILRVPAGPSHMRGGLQRSRSEPGAQGLARR